MTERQLQVWNQYLEDEWNRPSRSDYYLMRIAREVAVVLSSNPDKVQVEMFKMEFEQKEEKKKSKKERKFTEGEHIAYAKARWFIATGYRE